MNEVIELKTKANEPAKPENSNRKKRMERSILAIVFFVPLVVLFLIVLGVSRLRRYLQSVN